MATHPKKALPGSVPGRKTVLPLSRLGEVYALAASGGTIEEIAEGLGVNRSTLRKRRRNAPEFREVIERGRAEFSHSVKQGGVAYARLLAAKRAACAVQEEHERRIKLQLARMGLMALLGEAGHPPDGTSLPFTAGPIRETSQPGTEYQTYSSGHSTVQRQDADHCGTADYQCDGDPVPFTDPFARDQSESDYHFALDEPY